MANETLVANIQARFSELAVSEFRGQVRLTVARERFWDFITALHQDFGFDFLVDITCVDYLNYRGATHRFGLVYSLVNIETNDRLFVRLMLDEPDLEVPSVVAIWEGANWLEREVYDMFGISFRGHPDLRRILMPDEFAAYPLRKDYPLQGRGERHNFTQIARGDA